MPPPDSFTSDTFGFNDGREAGLRDYIFSRADVETTLRNNPQAIIDAISAYTSQKGMITLGRVKINKCTDLLARLDPSPKTLVELGCYVGMSALAWGDALKKLNATTTSDQSQIPSQIPSGGASPCKVFTTELHKTFASIARDLIALAGLDDTVTVLEGPAKESLRALKATGQIDTVDVMFFDHWKDAYLPDLQACEDLGIFRKGSLILADNTDIPGTPDFNRYLEDSSTGQNKGRSGYQYHVERHETEAEMGLPMSSACPEKKNVKNWWEVSNYRNSGSPGSQFSI
ncbi:hypothetical protein PV08_05823 [Exophiala spinifera]|uniref:catechol O-methyltransferase n=1 Tax=Exophiala spinifera TaxID=91928 RepID=A0A0D2B9U9_9EURO|nr:uncharacterized protein PV08_05823 [Exophiala spinifera]KIW15773.1 hypothetical protein PV08_05823 [Exophiala spinifera]